MTETDADGQIGLESQLALAQIEQGSVDVRETAASLDEWEELRQARV